LVSIHVVFLSASDSTGARISSGRVGAVERRHPKNVTSGFLRSANAAFNCGSVVHQEHRCHTGLLWFFELYFCQTYSSVDLGVGHGGCSNVFRKSLARGRGLIHIPWGLLIESLVSLGVGTQVW